ncbi:SPOR domain-containing protein [Pseudoalteromonas sp. T1lg48]|uniref:SPOR domain-containing protein n=1 Tax=Pseudoalteromonas sp. T1lg48 TaxID=2077100 RepID=UPI000CF6977F|nr:SPOR domain-containing protein [Pseudoalteromonas sp. T1lg48]
MNSGFVNRLIGTTIVVVAAIVFIPNILDGDKVSYKEGFKAIPERPEFKSIDLQQALSAKADAAPLPKDEEVEEVAADDDKLAGDPNAGAADGSVENSADDSAAKTVADSTTQRQESGSTGDTVTVTTLNKQEPLERPAQSGLTQMAYVVQLGAFSRQGSVDALMAKLKDNGFKVFTRKVKTPNGTLTKVLVGPELSKATLEQQLPKLQKLTNLQGRITQFQVTK